MHHSLYSTDPAEFEVVPGQLVGSLVTLAECEEAVRILDAQRAVMLDQIARDEANPGHRTAGWRASVQAALRWKKRIRTAVNARATVLRTKQGSNVHARRKAILALVFDAIGEPKLRRLVDVTRAKHPTLFAEGHAHAD